MKRRIKLGLVVVVIFLILVACDEGIKVDSDKGVEAKIEEIDYEKLSKYGGTEVGNNSNVSAIVYNLPGNIFFKSLELHTDREPFGITVKYVKNNIQENEIKEFLKTYKETAYENGREMFILIPDLVNLNLDFASMGGEKIIFNRSDFIGGKCGNSN